MIPTCEPFANAYLECRIIDVEISIFGDELFNTLRHKFMSCTELVLLLPQPLRQVGHLTSSKNTHLEIHGGKVVGV